MDLHAELSKIIGDHAADLANHDGVPVQPVHLVGATNNVAALLSQVRDALMAGAAAVEKAVETIIDDIEGKPAAETGPTPVPEPVAPPAPVIAPPVAETPAPATVAPEAVPAPAGAPDSPSAPAAETQPASEGASK